MAKKKTEQKTPATQQEIDQCLAQAVADGDIVNLRFLFVPFSPLREDSTEDLHTVKYAYLRPRDPGDTRFRESLSLVSNPGLQAFVRTQLEKKGPPQLPSELVMRLADNAVRLEKYTAAAQAYELLRIRRRMQEEFLRQADLALDENQVARAVQGYRAGTGLEYDYAAFPEPMPAVPNFQSRALILHAVYPHNPEDSVPLLPPETQVQTALTYLLLSAEIAARLHPRPMEQRLAFLQELVSQLDKDWSSFRERFRQACDHARAYGERLQRAAAPPAAGTPSLAEEIARQTEQEDPRRVSAILLGREIEQGEWWQYLKELAYKHPAAALFVARQAVTKDVEIILPRFRKDSPLFQALGLEG